MSEAFKCDKCKGYITVDRSGPNALKYKLTLEQPGSVTGGDLKESLEICNKCRKDVFNYIKTKI